MEIPHSKVLWVCLFVLVNLVLILYLITFPSFPTNLRKLSAANDLNTGESVRNTINGSIPEVSCPEGYYRPSGSTLLHRVSGQRQDGCNPCPKGRYGDRMGLTHSTCSGVCPVGTYSDVVGLKSVGDCKKCAPGTFATRSGLTTTSCSGMCPKGFYSDTYGAKKCKKCPKGYNMWQCVEA